MSSSIVAREHVAVGNSLFRGRYLVTGLHAKVCSYVGLYVCIMYMRIQASILIKGLEFKLFCTEWKSFRSMMVASSTELSSTYGIWSVQWLNSLYMDLEKPCKSFAWNKCDAEKKKPWYKVLKRMGPTFRVWNRMYVLMHFSQVFILFIFIQ
jgi:hypothetical protein